MGFSIIHHFKDPWGLLEHTISRKGGATILQMKKQRLRVVTNWANQLI